MKSLSMVIRMGKKGLFPIEMRLSKSFVSIKCWEINNSKNKKRNVISFGVEMKI